jgi:MFS family permease
MGEFTPAQQKGRTAYLGIAFMIMFTAFNSLQNIVSKIYSDYGYTNLGTASVLLLYFVYGAFTFVAPYLIRGLGYKKSMFFSSLGYGIFEAAGLIIALWSDMPSILGWIFVMVGAVFCGAGASVIWVAQGSYVSDLASEESRTKLFAMFWGLMMTSQVFGSILTTFVLGVIGNTAYFIVLTILGCICSSI